MMGITDIAVKKVVRRLDLGDFQPEYAGTGIDVWVNPPMGMTGQVSGLLQDWKKASAKRQLLENPLLGVPKEERLAAQKAAKLEKGTPEEIKRAKHEEEAAEEAYYRWFAQVWEDSTEEDVLAMAAKLKAEEPAMLIFLRGRTLTMIREYIEARKKA